MIPTVSTLVPLMPVEEGKDPGGALLFHFNEQDLLEMEELLVKRRKHEREYSSRRPLLYTVLPWNEEVPMLSQFDVRRRELEEESFQPHLLEIMTESLRDWKPRLSRTAEFVGVGQSDAFEGVKLEVGGAGFLWRGRLGRAEGERRTVGLDYFKLQQMLFLVTKSEKKRTTLFKEMAREAPGWAAMVLRREWSICGYEPEWIPQPLNLGKADLLPLINHSNQDVRKAGFIYLGRTEREARR